MTSMDAILPAVMEELGESDPFRASWLRGSNVAGNLIDADW